MYVLRRDAADYSQWSTGTIVGAENALHGGLEVLRDDRTILVATAPEHLHDPPLYVRKYSLPDTISENTPIGAELGRFLVDSVAVEIFPTADGKRAHIFTSRGKLHTIDVESMTEVAPSIQVPGIVGMVNTVWEGDSTSSTRRCRPTNAI